MSVAYGKRVVLEDVCLCCDRGQIIGLLGPNGSGKSTLLKSLVGLVPRASGCVSLDGATLEGRQRQSRIAYVPQRNDVDWGFPITVEDVVLLGCQGRLGLFGRPGPVERAAAWAALERVEMSAHRRAQIGDLSGGQQQRVFLARALAQGGDVLLGVLDELRCDGRAIMLTTHDRAAASELCNACYELRDGRAATLQL